MKIGLLLPSVLTSHAYSDGRIFAPLTPAISLADGLVENGHEVFFYTSNDVRAHTKATVIPGLDSLTNEKLSYYQFRNRSEEEQKYTTTEIIKRDFENELTMRAYADAKAGKIDLVHSYHDFSAHYFENVTNITTLHALHNPLPTSKDTIEYHRFELFKDHKYISISDSQRRGLVALNFVATIHHGIDLDKFPFVENSNEHLLFIGRMMEDKGPDIAIQVAKTAGLSLRIATSMDESNRSGKYYDEKIAPHIDGKNVVMDGYKLGVDKAAFLGSGKAFVFPMMWDEPFGLVMVESMAAGTPVVVYNRGSASEIVKDGVTGFIIDPDETDRPGKGNWVIKKTGIEGLVEAVRRIGEIDRQKCREHVEKHFSKERMVMDHEKLYKQFV